MKNDPVTQIKSFGVAIRRAIRQASVGVAAT